MAADIVLPEARLLGEVLVRHAEALAAHGDEARLEVEQEIVLKAHAPARVVFLQILHKAGVVDGGGGIDDGVVVVKDQALVFHKRLRSRFFHSIAQQGRRKKTLTNIARLCYTITVLIELIQLTRDTNPGERGKRA